MGMGNIGAFRALRTLRALRPLRAVSRWEGMKVGVYHLNDTSLSLFILCPFRSKFETITHLIHNSFPSSTFSVGCYPLDFNNNELVTLVAQKRHRKLYTSKTMQQIHVIIGVYHEGRLIRWLIR